MKKLSPSITEIPPSKSHGRYTYHDSCNETSLDTQSHRLSAAVETRNKRVAGGSNWHEDPFAIENREEPFAIENHDDPFAIENQKPGDKEQARLPCVGAFLRIIVSRIVGVVLFVFVLSTLVVSKLSFLVMTQHFNDTRLLSLNESVESLKTRKAANFWSLLLALIIPSLFSFLQCICCGLISGRQINFPWPNKLAVFTVSLTLFACFCF